MREYELQPYGTKLAWLVGSGVSYEWFSSCRISVSCPYGRKRTQPQPLPEGGRNAMALASRQQQQRKESDLFTGASNRFAIGTLAERTIGYVLLVHLQDNDTAEATSAGVARGVMSTFPAGLRHMLTWDQGIELARNNRLADDLGTSMQFCEANFPWQRQTNENTNGLLSDYFPSEPTSHPTPPNGPQGMP